MSQKNNSSVGSSDPSPSLAPAASETLPWRVDVALAASFAGITHTLFYHEQQAAAEAYETLAAVIRAYQAHTNDLVRTVEIADALGQAQFTVSEMMTARVYNEAALFRAHTARIIAQKALGKDVAPAVQTIGEARTGDSQPATEL